jgi:hypothetical protein
MKNILLFAEILPLFIFYLFFANPDSMIWFSLTYLGKLTAILIILFYADLHWIYGLFICVCIILYYQSDLIEGMQMQESMLSNSSIHKKVEGFAHLSVPQDVEMQVLAVNQSKNNPLANNSTNSNTDRYKPVASDSKVDSYSFLRDFTYEHTGNPDEDILIGITELKLKTQEEITYPKASDEWVYRVWKTWFIEDHSPPYPAIAKTIITPGSYEIVQYPQ